MLLFFKVVFTRKVREVKGVFGNVKKWLKIREH